MTTREAHTCPCPPVQWPPPVTLTAVVLVTGLHPCVLPSTVGAVMIPIFAHKVLWRVLPVDGMDDCSYTANPNEQQHAGERTRTTVVLPTGYMLVGHPNYKPRTEPIMILFLRRGIQFIDFTVDALSGLGQALGYCRYCRGRPSSHTRTRCSLHGWK